MIYSYTRAQAIDDGVLIDVTKIAREAGFKFPVACTSGLFYRYIETVENVPEDYPPQDESGRLWDLLTMLRYGIKKSNGREIVFSFIFQMPNANDWKHQYEQEEPEAGKYARLVKLQAFCGPGDSMEPVITIMQMDED